MVIEFGDLPHLPTSFLAANLISHVEFIPGKSSSASDANFVASSNVGDPRFMCDTPLATKGAGACGCSVASSKGLVGEAGRTFPGSALGADGSQTAVLGPLGIQAAGAPHPAFTFERKVTDVTVNMQDVTNPTQPKLIWDQRFRLMGTNGEPGKTRLESSDVPIDQSGTAFHRLCGPINAWRTFKIRVMAGGEAPIDHTMMMRSVILKLPEDMGAGETVPADGAGGPDGSFLKAVGPRISEVGGGDQAPANDSVPAVRNSSFALMTPCQSGREVTAFAQSPACGPYYVRDGTMLLPPQLRGFPAVTSTSFADDDGCQPPPPPKNPPFCHKLPTVSVHVPSQISNFF